MAIPDGRTWTLHEKNELLAEIIKANAPAVHVLMNVILSLNMTARLEDIPLPSGRSYNSSRNAYETMRREASMSATTGSLGIQTPSPISATLHAKRPFPYEPASLPAGRQLAPKPTTGGPYGQPTTQIDQPPKKRRGRPPKSDTQAKKGIQTMGGEPSSVVQPPFTMVPMSMPVTAQPPELPQAMQTPMVERRQSQPAVSRMNISSMLAATPTGPGSTSHSSSSSGKRRRGRSTRLEPEEGPPGATASGGESFAPYESPYPRIGEEAFDSPARAAMMRRREEPRMEEQQQPGGQQPLSSPGYTTQPPPPLPQLPPPPQQGLQQQQQQQ